MNVPEYVVDGMKVLWFKQTYLKRRAGELGCLCGKAGTSHLCDGSAHSSGCVVNGSNAMAAV